MGYGIIVKCKNCCEIEYDPEFFFGQEFMLGTGMMYSSLENVIDLLHYTRRPKVQEILDNHKVKDTDYSNELFHCPECHRLHSRFYVKITYDYDQVYETAYNCSKCKAPMDMVSEEDLPRIPCANCGQKTLFVDEMMMWD